MMWYFNKKQHPASADGWHACYKDESGCWFFHRVGTHGIAWLQGGELNTSNGALHAFSGFFNRGQWDYRSEQERDTWWDKILDDPDPFLVRIALTPMWWDNVA